MNSDKKKILQIAQGNCFEVLNKLSANFDYVWTAPQSWLDGNCSVRVVGGRSNILQQLVYQAKANSLNARISLSGGVPWLQIQPQPFPIDSIPVLGKWAPAKDSVFLPVRPTLHSYSVNVDITRIDADTAKTFGIDISSILGYFSWSALKTVSLVPTVTLTLRQGNILDSIKRVSHYSFSVVDSLSLEIGQEYKEEQATINYKEGNSVTQYNTLLSGFQMGFVVDSNQVGRYRIEQLGQSHSKVSASMLYGTVRHNFQGLDVSDSVSGWWFLKRKTKIRHNVVYSVRVDYALDTLSFAK